MDFRLEVVVPVSDVDLAKHFYAGQTGFVVDVDHAPGDDIRIVQLTPSGSACSVTIGKGLADTVPGWRHGVPGQPGPPVTPWPSRSQATLSIIEAAGCEAFPTVPGPPPEPPGRGPHG